MGNATLGQALWLPWDVEDETTSFYTFGHVNLDLDIIRLSLAKAIQQEGVASSLGDAFRLLDQESTTTEHLFVGHIGGSYDLTLCDTSGDTDSQGHIDEEEPRSITLVGVDTDGD